MLQPGSNILNGKYRILRLIGEGGFARVWLAEEPAAGRQVAIKEIRREELSGAERHEVEKRFANEIQIGAKLPELEVPNVIRVITAERWDSDTLLVMEYLSGGSLADRLKTGPLEVSEAVTITLQLLEALDAVHTKLGLVHRDIKPSNILFNSEGEARLADFGIAQTSETDRTLGTGRDQPGTPGYKSPEQRQTTGYLTPRSDLYTLGCVLFEMLTGRRYQACEPGTKARALQKSVPAWLEGVIAQALIEDPWRRWQSAREMADGLRARECQTSSSGECPVELPDIAISVENAAQLSELARWGKGRMTDLQFSPDGQLIVAATSAGVFLYDAATYDELRYLDANAPVNCIALSEDGQMIAATCPDDRLLIWRSSDGALLRNVHMGLNQRNSVFEDRLYVEAMAFAGNNLLALCMRSPLFSGESEAQIREVTAELPLCSMPLEYISPLSGEGSPIRCAAFALDGSTAAVILRNGDLLAWSARDRAHFRNLETAKENARVLTLSPDGSMVAIGFADGAVRILRTSDGKPICDLIGAGHAVFSLVFTPEGGEVAAGYRDGTVRLWRISDDTFLRSFAKHEGAITSLAFSRDALSLAVVSDDGARLYEFEDGRLQSTLGRFTWTMDFALSPLNDTLAVPGGGAVRLLRIQDGSLLEALDIDPGSTGNSSHAVAFSPDDRLLASGYSDHMVALWSVNDRKLLHLLQGHRNYIWDLAFSPDSRWLASASLDSTIRLWRTDDGTLASTLYGHVGKIYCLAWAPTGDILVSGGEDGTIRLWDPKTGNVLRTLTSRPAGKLVRLLQDAKHRLPFSRVRGKQKDAPDLINCVAFAPDGQTFASGASTRIMLWRASDGVALRTFSAREHGDGAVALAFSSDAQILAAGGCGLAPISLWSVSDAVLLAQVWQDSFLRGTRKLQFSPDGRFLIALHDDLVIRFWGIR